MFVGSLMQLGPAINARTRRKCRAAWGRFQAWAEREDLSTMPAAPETGATYLA